MQELLELILKNIVTSPEAVSVVVSQEDDREVYTITVDPADMGRVIGKSGKVIKAIRALAHVVAIRQGKRFRINLADEAGDTHVAEEVAADQPETEEVADVIDLSAEAVESEEVAAAQETAAKPNAATDTEVVTDEAAEEAIEVEEVTETAEPEEVAKPAK